MGTRAGGAPVSLGGVRLRFGDTPVLDGIDAGLAAGERVAVVGPSGCGKSTLLHVIAGLEHAEGAVAVDGAAEPQGRLAACALMPQRDLLLPWRTALDNAALPLINAGLGRARARDAARPLFRRFGLAGFEDSPPARLSGGMRQRVAFARTVLAGKPVLLLDEPFASLDALTREELGAWLASALDEEARTVVLVTHDVSEALRVCDRVIALSPRPARVRLDAPAEELTREGVIEALRR